MPKISVGVASVLPPSTIATVAAAVEDAGLFGLWINDGGGDVFAALGAAAEATDRLTLAVGVIPVDRRTPAEIARSVSALPLDRLVIGIGSGAGGRGSLARVGAAADALKDVGAPVMVGALGPKMRELAATRTAGPLLSWLPPSIAGKQADEAHALNPSAHVALYVRASTHPDAVTRLTEEARRYGSYPNYSANLARLGTTAEQATLPPTRISAGIAEYAAVVDELVLRAITPDDEVESYVRFVNDVAGLAPRS